MLDRYNKKEVEAETKKVEKIIKGEVITKKNKFKKIGGVFIQESASNVGQHIFLDVVVPTIKELVFNAITTSIEMMFYGEMRTSKNKSSNNRVSYNRIYSGRDDKRETTRYYNRSNTFDNDIILETRLDAENVLEEMENIIDKYDFVTVGDLYDSLGMATSPSDFKYGWSSMRNASIKRVRDGYLLEMPKVMSIE